MMLHIMSKLSQMCIGIFAFLTLSAAEFQLLFIKEILFLYVCIAGNFFKNFKYDYIHCNQNQAGTNSKRTILFVFFSNLKNMMNQIDAGSRDKKDAKRIRQRKYLPFLLIKKLTRQECGCKNNQF